MAKITCKECGREVPVIDWAPHKNSHAFRPHAQPSLPFNKKLMKAASSFVDSMARAGGGSVSINGEEVVSIPPRP